MAATTWRVEMDLPCVGRDFDRCGGHGLLHPVDRFSENIPSLAPEIAGRRHDLPQLRRHLGSRRGPPEEVNRLGGVDDCLGEIAPRSDFASGTIHRFRSSAPSAVGEGTAGLRAYVAAVPNQGSLSTNSSQSRGSRSRHRPSPARRGGRAGSRRSRRRPLPPAPRQRRPPAG